MKWMLLLCMTAIGSMASIQLKFASRCTLRTLFRDEHLYCGGLLYLISSILNIYLLRMYEYSEIFPLCSITYFWTIFLGWVFFSEKIAVRKICGVMMILVGCGLIAFI